MTSGKNDDWAGSAVVLSAASCPEELSEGELERFHAYYRHPLDINSASRRQLLACGFLSSYQISVLLDYRASCGAIASYTELASLDGFSLEMARALQSFTVLSSCSSEEKSDFSGLVRYSNSLSAKVKYEGPFDASLALKGVDSFVSLLKVPSGFSLGYGHKNWNVILGDYRARFGQGLTLWSGFSLSGVSTPEAILRTGANGIAATNSFSSDSHFRGAAACCDIGRMTFSAMWNAEPGLFAANSTRYTSKGTYGVTFVADPSVLRLGADYLFTPGKVSYFGEAAVERLGGGGYSYAAVAGAQWNISYQKLFSGAVRCYPVVFSGGHSLPLRASSLASDELGACAGLRLGKFFFTADWALHPAKGAQEGVGIPYQVKFISQFAPEFGNWTFKIKGVARYRNYESCPLRTEARLDVAWTLGGLNLGGRADYVHSVSDALHFMVCAGYKNAGAHKWSAYLRASVFKVDNWADRIYVYERDVPSSFSVPAYYGRGVALGPVLAYEGFCFSLSWKTYPNGERADGLSYKVQWSF